MDDTAPEARDYEGLNARQFDALSGTYDRLGFLARTALHVAEQAQISDGQAVLDVATGTGTAALAVATRVGKSGRVVGLDIAPRMIQVAQQRAQGQAQGQVAFVVGSGAALPFANGDFDVVLCASGLFYLPDMHAALREWWRVLKPGGQVWFSSFGPGLLGTLPGRWRECLARHGATPGSPPLGRLPTAQAAQDLLIRAGFALPVVTLSTLAYTLADPQARWADIAAGMEGAPLRDLSPAAQANIRDEHLLELQEIFDGQALTVPLPVLLACGTRPA